MKPTKMNLTMKSETEPLTNLVSMKIVVTVAGWTWIVDAVLEDLGAAGEEVSVAVAALVAVEVDLGMTALLEGHVRRVVVGREKEGHTHHHGIVPVSTVSSCEVQCTKADFLCQSYNILKNGEAEGAFEACNVEWLK